MKTKLLLSLVALLFVSVLVLLYLNLQKPTPPIVSIPTITTNPTKSIDPTANWKTYNNSADRISFMYPPSYLLKETNIPKDFITMLQGKDYKVITNDFGSKNAGSYYYLSLNITCLPADIVGDQKILYTTNNSTVYAITGYEGPNYKSAIFNHNDLCYELNCVTDNGCEGKSLTEFNQILSTFKFTNNPSFSGNIQIYSMTDIELVVKNQVSSPSPISEMSLWMDNSSPHIWKPYQEIANVSIPNSQSECVYVQFKNSTGQISPVYSDATGPLITCK